ncbi:MAG: RidA family protein [Christensenellaceae bacterium]|nr:RidA family protein [Christensenellaceae bacterium]
MEKQLIHTDLAPQAIGPYVQADKLGDMVFTSGQLGIDVEKGGLAEGIEAQTHAAMKNLGAILRESGSDYAKVLKSTIFVTDLNDFAAVNQIYASYFEGAYPARSCVQVAKLPLGGLVEIECVASIS